MASGWQNKLARLSQMKWDEIRTRAGQEFHKQSDLAHHRLGRPPTAVPIRESAPNRATFFFPNGGAQERAAVLRQHLSGEALAIIHEADAIRQHHFQLLGYEDVDYGPEIDWHLDRVHQKRSPLDPWFRVPFLDFAVVGDHKVTWELNRHQHLVTLAKAWLLSNDDKYVREILAQFRSWTRSNPYPLGINWGSSLEAAFRSLSWIWVDQLLTGAPGYAEFHEELLPSLAFHGRYIERYLSTYFSPNTHLIGESVALFFIGTLYPQITAGERWQSKGWKILLKEAQRQVRPDGVYFEQSLHYHVYALDFFLHARLLAGCNGLNVPTEFDSTMRRMLDVVQALSLSGPPEGFGDDDGGRVFNPRRNRTEHMTDPLALGKLLYGRKDLGAARLTEESIWLFGSQAVEGSLREEPRPATISTAFPDGGLYILADSDPVGHQITVDAGPQGIGRSGHGHADALSLRLTMNGERWLVDAGTGVYISADPADRHAFRGTAAHNTMQVDGMDQAEVDGPFAWSALPTTRVDNWIAGKSFSYFSGSHDGYTRLTDPVTHWRHVAQINGGPTLVRDVAFGQQEHELDVLWHFSPELEIRKDGRNAWMASRSGAGQPALSIIVPDDTPWHTEISTSLISAAYGKFEPAPLLRAHSRLRLPAEIATLLSPHSTAAGHASNLVAMRHAAVQAYEWAEEDANHGFCFALDKRPWNFGPWFSDAEFLYCRIAAAKLTHMVVVGGTYLAWQGRELLKAPGPSAFFEWRKNDEMLHAEPGRFSISPLFQELTGGAILPAETSNMTST